MLHLSEETLVLSFASAECEAVSKENIKSLYCAFSVPFVPATKAYEKSSSLMNCDQCCKPRF